MTFVMPTIPKSVFNSAIPTVAYVGEEDSYGKAHHYVIQKCIGFKDGQTQYVEEYQCIDFIKKTPDGVVVPGIQNEQVYIMLIDRINKLNSQFPDPRNDEQIKLLERLLELCEERVKERISRGVMGELKK